MILIGTTGMFVFLINYCLYPNLVDLCAPCLLCRMPQDVQEPEKSRSDGTNQVSVENTGVPGGLSGELQLGWGGKHDSC